MSKIFNINMLSLILGSENYLKVAIVCLGLKISFRINMPQDIVDNLLIYKNRILFIKDINKTVYIKLQGRLGNQMFIHAFAKKLVKENNVRIIYDNYSRIYCLNKYYNIDTEFSNINYNIIFPDELKFLSTRPFYYDRKLINQKFLYYCGYFQSENYFKEFRNELLKEFKTKIPFDDEYLLVKHEIENSESVLLNFRVCEDYMRLGWVLDFSYQKEAIEYILTNVTNPEFFVFSDDIEYIKKNFNINKKLTYVDIGKKNPNKICLDMELMKLCKHAIIPNSTFSWWAAWLNENPNKIIVAPDPWLHNNSDIVLPSWHKIKAKTLS